MTWNELCSEIDSLEQGLRDGSEEALQERAAWLRHAAATGTAPEDLLTQCLALVREAARRTLGLRPFREQILAGIALHEGRLVEMKTGEGKTLAAVGPVTLNSLGGRGVHVLTHNDYLATRDAEWMRPIYETLGVSVASVVEGTDIEERQRAYSCDVTYVTAKEAGFDRLRDGLCLESTHRVHRPFHLAVVDEADSILIDEARIPLVIAGSDETVAGGLFRLAEIARTLVPETDFATDEHSRNIFLTDRGIERAEEMLACSLFDSHNVSLQAELRNALHAEALLHRNVDYIVRDGRVELVDELTGRVAENRHWPDGLQSALEAKESLHLQPEGRILGSLTMQHFLLRYPRLCGMTATARSGADEIEAIYGLEVVSIPTHEPCVRIDHPDVVFTHKEAKKSAILAEIAKAHSTGRPILLGTVSVEESEQLATELRSNGVHCTVLNARNDEEEAAIIAGAGALGAVTISTNMAGRGTDIRLGGADEKDRDRVLALGGLYVIGTNRHESRRTDDQLRGRAGRQGDPGSSRFLISLEDDLLVRYGIERLLPGLALPRGSDEPIDHPAVRREIARAQRIVEGENSDIRKRLMAYSSVLEKQARAVRKWRRSILDGEGDLDLLAAQSPQRWRQLCRDYGHPFLRSIERRLTLLIIDRCWSEHLAAMQHIRDEIHLVKLDGRDPLTEFYRQAGPAYEALLERIDREITETFERIEITANGVDWDREGLHGPSATWTYLVNDNVFDGNPLLMLANRPSMALGAVFMLPGLFVWGLFLHWKRWRRRRAQRPGPR